MFFRFIWALAVFAFYVDSTITFKRFDKTNFMSENVWKNKIFDISAKSSLIVCIAHCTSWEGQNCNAIYYGKESKTCELAEISQLVDISENLTKVCKLNFFIKLNSYYYIYLTIAIYTLYR